jgi:hypothetical protein
LTHGIANEARSRSGLFFAPGSIRGDKINSGLRLALIPDVPAALAVHYDDE